MINRQRILAGSILLAAVVAVTGCGSSDDGNDASTTPVSGTPATGPHNAADVRFATDMVPHHAQAVEMADMAVGSATDDRVKSLAASIESAQDPEIMQMNGWLKGWGEGTPDTSMTGMPGMHHGAGMMTDAEMSALSNASGADFDRMWVQMMIRHHQGAVAMARTEIGTGQNPDAKLLAQSIVDSQTAQIAEMRRLLSDL